MSEILIDTNIRTHDRWIMQHHCRRCGRLLCESGYLRFPGVKEVRMIGSWRKDNYMIKTVVHPLDKHLPESQQRIICIDVLCKCDNCGKDNTYIVSTTLDDKKKIRIQYSKIQELKGNIHA